MPLFLPERAAHLTEKMDLSGSNPEKLRNTLAQFRHINSYLSGWKRLFYRYILPQCTDTSRTYTLLDIGCGGGDIPLMLSGLAKKSGINLKITGIDTDPRAIAFLEGQKIPETVTFRHVHTHDLATEGAVFDFVISNHLIHHLSENELITLAIDAEKLARRMILFNDLRRSGAAMFWFNLFTLFAFRDSFIREDGLISIRKSFVPAELEGLLPDGWQVIPIKPFRLLILKNF